MLATSIVALVGAGTAHAGDKRLAEMTLEELLDLDVAVTSRTPTPARKAPGIVTVLTRDELLDLGARDLIDVLELVPGLAFGVDVVGVVGIGVRGNWGHEGKVLLLVDGTPLNEMQYGTIAFGHRISIAHIERIEVIRGPGSVVYGGSAELGVINVVTRAAAGPDGLTVEASYGQFAGGAGDDFAGDYARRTVSASWAQHVGDVRVHARGFIGQGQRSDRDYVDLAGDRYDLEGNSALDPFAVAAGVDVRGLTARAGVEHFRTTFRDGYDLLWTGPEPMRVDFTTAYAHLAYKTELTDDVALTPFVQVLHQRPWSYPQEQAVGTFFYFGTTGTRTSTGVRASIDVTERVAVQLGLEGYHEVDTVDDKSGPEYLFPGGEKRATFDDATLYAETIVTTRWLELTAGGRAELHTETGLTAVPRIAATRRAGRLHGKALVAQGFRAPSAQNLRLNPDIAPERTTALELEAGYRFTDHLAATANVFDLTIRDPIIYGYDVDTMLDSYINEPRTGSRGVELEAVAKTSRVRGTLGYSFYTAAGKNEVDDFRVERDRERLLAFPRHKLTLRGTVVLAKRVHLSPSLMFLGRRPAYVAADLDGNPVLGTLEREVVADLSLRVLDVGTPGLELGVGIFDILDSRMDYAQPYAGGHLPYPAPSREILARIAYTTP